MIKTIPLSLNAIVLTVTSDGKTAYVALNSASPGGRGSVSLVSTGNLPVSKPIKVASNLPLITAITPDGKVLYVGDWNTGTVILVDTATSSAGKPIKVGLTPEAIVISPNGKIAYVLNPAPGGPGRAPSPRSTPRLTPRASPSKGPGRSRRDELDGDHPRTARPSMRAVTSRDPDQHRDQFRACAITRGSAPWSALQGRDLAQRADRVCGRYVLTEHPNKPLEALDAAIAALRPIPGWQDPVPELEAYDPDEHDFSS